MEFGGIDNGGECEANVYQDPFTTEMLQFVVDGAGSDQLLHHLPAVGQPDPESSKKPSGDDLRGFYWIFKNIDFERWESTKGLQVLWIYGPAECCISDASSRIVDQAMKTSSESGAQHPVLYFFCSTAPTKVPIAITFISTIIHQLLRSLPGLKEKVTTVFLRTEMGRIPGIKRKRRKDIDQGVKGQTHLDPKDPGVKLPRHENHRALTVLPIESNLRLPNSTDLVFNFQVTMVIRIDSR